MARAEILMYNGQADEGLPLALRAAEISQKQGHRRRLERIYHETLPKPKSYPVRNN